MANHIMNPTHAFRGCQIDELEIAFPIKEQFHYDPWSCMKLLQYFPSILSLTLLSTGAMYLDYDMPSAQLRFLKIENTQVTFLPILWSFPHLEGLEFNHLSFSVNEPGDHTPTVMTRLELLDMQQTEYSLEMLDRWLRQVSCPILSTLQIGIAMIHAWIPFISSHRSITDLEACNLSVINKLAEVAPQLQTLVINPQNEDPIPATLLGDDIHAFNQLETLFFYDIRPEVVSLDKFEDFVRSRCLPSHHPEFQRPDPLEPLKTLTFIVAGVNPDNRVWMTSELYHQAHKDFEVNIDVTHIALSWI